MRTQTIQKFLRAATLSVAVIVSAPAVQAQSYYGNFGYGLGYSLLYPLTYLPYQLLYGLRYGNGGYYGSNGYAPNNLINQASYAPYGYLPYGGKFGLGTNQYQNSNQYQNYGNYGQTGYAPLANNPQPASVPQPASYNNQVPYNTQPAPNNNPAPNNQSYYQQGQDRPFVDPLPTPQTSQPQTTAFNGSPVLAPHTNPPAVDTPPATDFEAPPPVAPERPVSHMPFADGFIQTVNHKYNGNISRALKDHELRSWAEALSLIDRQTSRHLNLSTSREEAIAKILKDDSLDSQSKLETLRILLR